MTDIILLEGLQALQHLNGRLVADGAVRTVADHNCQFLHLDQGIHVRPAAKDLDQHLLQLPQTIPAGYSFAAGLVP